MARPSALHTHASRYLTTYTDNAAADVKAQVQANPALTQVQADHAVLCASRLLKPGLFVLNNPVGTGKTPIALTVAALLLNHVAPSKRIRRAIVIAPNSDAAKMWQERADQAGLSVSRKRDSTSSMVVLTASQIGNRPFSKDPADQLVIVDEAHRGLQSDTKRRAQVAHVARGARVLLVTATPFQLTGAGLESFLSVGGSLSRPQQRHVEQLSKGMVSYLTAVHDAETGTDQQVVLEEVVSRKRTTLAAIATTARPTLDALFMPPFPVHEVYGVPPDSQGRSPLPASPVWVELDQWATAYHAARVLPAIWPDVEPGQSGIEDSDGQIRNSDSYMRMLSSSFAAWEGHQAVKRAESRDPKSVGGLVKAVTAGTHPKIAATAEIAVETLLKGSHVLIFCVYRDTQKELKTAIQAAVRANGRLRERRVEAPTTHPEAERFRKEYFGSDQEPAGVLIVRDNLSEAIDLDGGRPVVIHHDLFWSPVRWEQRMGRVVRASTGFQPAKNTFVPLLRTDSELRMWETLRRRLQLSAGVITGLIPDHDSNNGEGSPAV